MTRIDVGIILAFGLICIATANLILGEVHARHVDKLFEEYHQKMEAISQ